jgi:hypothetical protein
MHNNLNIRREFYIIAGYYLQLPGENYAQDNSRLLFNIAGQELYFIIASYYSQLPGINYTL